MTLRLFSENFDRFETQFQTISRNFHIPKQKQKKEIEPVSKHVSCQSLTCQVIDTKDCKKAMNIDDWVWCAFACDEKIVFIGPSK